MKKIVFILMLVFFTICSCEKSGEQEKKFKIGLAVHTYADQGTSYLFAGIEDSSKANKNIELTILDAKNDVGIQISQVENLLTTGHDAIMILPVDRASLGNMLRLIQDAGIIVVVLNRLPLEVDFEYIDMFVGIDEKEAGIGMAKQLLVDLESAGRIDEEMEIGILQGILGQDGTVARTAGFKEALKDYPNLKITRETTANWERGLAINVVENWIQSDIDSNIKVIFANNDEMALGASLAISQVNRKDILIYGVDATPAGVEAIGQGLTATIEQDLYAIGEIALDSTIELLKGKEVENLVDEKFYYVPLNVVTIENREEMLEKKAKLNK